MNDIMNCDAGKDIDPMDEMTAIELVYQYRESKYQIECNNATDYDIDFIEKSIDIAKQKGIKLPVYNRHW